MFWSNIRVFMSIKMLVNKVFCKVTLSSKAKGSKDFEI